MKTAVNTFFQLNLKHNPDAYLYEWDLSEHLDRDSYHHLMQRFHQLNIISTEQIIAKLQQLSPTHYAGVINFLKHQLAKRDGNVYYQADELDYHHLKPLTYRQIHQLTTERIDQHGHE